MAIVYGSEPGSPVTEDEIAKFVKFNAEAKSAGVLLGSEALQPADTATVVRSMDRGVVVTDGPYSETGEPIVGFYILECENLDEAIEWAAKLPHARTGAVEVRPAVEMDES